MNIGAVAEYIDQQKILCAVITGSAKAKFRLISETGREVVLSEKRFFHLSLPSLDTTQPRVALIQHLKNTAELRRRLSEQINIPEMWELLQGESGEIDLASMMLFCFDPPLTPDHESAVLRAFFSDRLYFRFANGLFTPSPPELVAARQRELEDVLQRDLLIQNGANWLNAMHEGHSPPGKPDPKIIDILSAFYLTGTDSPTAGLARQIIRKSRAGGPDALFSFFVRSGIWHPDENLDLITLQIPVSFPPAVQSCARKLCDIHGRHFRDDSRENLTDVPLITIDGQSTLDYDDAISLEYTDQGYRLGIHIIDVAAYIHSGDPIDLAARERGSSIYLPDDRLPMIPANLSEDLCSLKEGQVRPGISTLVDMNRFFEMTGYRIVPSIIRVHQQMSYTEANVLNGKDDPITSLHRIALMLREKRLKSGAVQITLPEVTVWLEADGEIRYTKVDRENPARMMISEMMIFANSLMAEFLAAHDMPAVFRSQSPPGQRLFKGIETALFPNLMQRRHLSRAVIGTTPESHSGLGVSAYVTATSPIRRYHDLLTQRQIKAILGLGPSYSRSELDAILQAVTVPMANAGRIQASRKRYWLLKYLEAQRGSEFEALVIDCRRDQSTVILKEFMLEARMPAPGPGLKVGDVLSVVIQHADARRNQLSLFAA